MLCCSCAWGQILNIEKYRSDKDTSRVWAGNVGFGLSAKKQQTSLLNLNTNCNLAYFSLHHSYMNISYFKFVAIQESEVISEGYTHFRALFDRKRFVSYEPFVQFQYDLGRGLLKRQLAGFTFRFNFLSTEKVHMAANTGAMYEQELWEGEVLRYPISERPDRAETYFIKSTSNFSIRGDISNNVYLLFVTYYQARFEKFLTPRIISDVQLNVKMSRFFSISNQFTSTYDALPILRDNKFIFSLNTNLTLNF